MIQKLLYVGVRMAFLSRRSRTAFACAHAVAFLMFAYSAPTCTRQPRPGLSKLQPQPALDSGHHRPQQWPRYTSTVATVQQSGTMAGARIRPEDSTVATEGSNRGHSHGIRGLGRGRMRPMCSTVATEQCNSGHRFGIRGHGRRWHSASGLNCGHSASQQWPQFRHPPPRPARASSLST